jgi:hypothetical protein
MRVAACDRGPPQVSGSIHDRDVHDIARELERYIDAHPSAADTVDGIARWWLAGPMQPPVRQVEAALDALIRRGVLARRLLPDGNSVYVRAARARPS